MIKSLEIKSGIGKKTDVIINGKSQGLVEEIKFEQVAPGYAHFTIKYLISADS